MVPKMKATRGHCKSNLPRRMVQLEICMGLTPPYTIELFLLGHVPRIVTPELRIFMIFVLLPPVNRPVYPPIPRRSRLLCHLNNPPHVPPVFQPLFPVASPLVFLRRDRLRNHQNNHQNSQQALHQANLSPNHLVLQREFQVTHRLVLPQLCHRKFPLARLPRSLPKHLLISLLFLQLASPVVSRRSCRQVFRAALPRVHHPCSRPEYQRPSLPLALRHDPLVGQAQYRQGNQVALHLERQVAVLVVSLSSHRQVCHQDIHPVPRLRSPLCSHLDN